jgi:DNA-binding CsgD family transcriptional regulator
MEAFSADMLSFVQLLVGAHDPASLYRAFQVGLGAVFSHHSFVSSFAFDREHGGPISTWSCPARPEHTPDWWARNAAIHPGYEYASKHLGIPVCLCSDAVPNSAFEAHPYYQTFVKPEGYRYAMAILVWDGPQVVGYVAINRALEQGDFTEVERARALKLHPFIAAAYLRISSARVADDVRHAQERLLATLPIAVCVYSTRDGRVLFHNRASKEALARWRGEDNQKRPRAVTARWLPDEIVSACASVPAGGVAVRSARTPMRAELRKMDPRSHFASDVVLIVIEDDDGPAGKRTSGAWLRVARRLSTAEQDVAKLVATGLTNVEIGRRLGKSALTVKKQLEAVFAKARVANRAELTAVVAGLPGRASGKARRA